MPIAVGLFNYHDNGIDELYSAYQSIVLLTALSFFVKASYSVEIVYGILCLIHGESFELRLNWKKRELWYEVTLLSQVYYQIQHVIVLRIGKGSKKLP